MRLWLWCFKCRGNGVASLFCGLAIIICSGIGLLWAQDKTAAPAPTPIYHGDEQTAKVAFACNVFWGEEFLPSMLQTMAANNVKITFFIGGTWAAQHPDMLRQISAQGHELGNHSYNHPHPNALSKQQNQEQIQRTADLIYEITGVRTCLYAPPYGEFNHTVLAAAHELGYQTILWSADTIDWQRPPADVIVARVLKKLTNGTIILMHPTAPTAQALPALIRAVQSRGYTITTVSDVLPASVQSQ